MSNKGETMIAVLPSALAEVLCRYCRGCEYGVKRHPHQCKAIKNFINQVKQKSNKNTYGKMSKKRYQDSSLRPSPTPTVN